MLMDTNIKYKLTKMYKSLLDSLDLKDKLNLKFYKLVSDVDARVNNKIKTLFLISLYCNVFYHVYGKNKSQLSKPLSFKPTIRCSDFKVFTFDKQKTIILLKLLITYFNTDAINILPITGKIIEDLNSMKIYIDELY